MYEGKRTVEYLMEWNDQIMVNGASIGIDDTIGRNNRKHLKIKNN